MRTEQAELAGNAQRALARRPAALGARRYVGLALLGLLAVLLALPNLASTYLLVFLIGLFYQVVLAASYDLVGGYMGYINLGHAAFFGLGAYAFAIGTTRGLPVAPAIALAVAAA